MTRDEQRQAWRTYAAAVSAHDSMVLNECTQWADKMLEEERLRFDQPDHSGDANKMVEPRPWVDLTEADISETVMRWHQDLEATHSDLARLTQDRLREKNGGTR